MLEKEVLKRIIFWSVLSVIPVVVILLCYFLAGITLANIFTVVGVVYLGAAGLVFVHRCGTFDTFEYQFGTWLSSWRKNSPKRYESANEYHITQTEKRKHNKFVYLPFFVYGGGFLIAGIIMSIILVASKS